MTHPEVAREVQWLGLAGLAEMEKQWHLVRLASGAEMVVDEDNHGLGYLQTCRTIGRGAGWQTGRREAEIVGQEARMRTGLGKKADWGLGSETGWERLAGDVGWMETGVGEVTQRLGYQIPVAEVEVFENRLACCWGNGTEDWSHLQHQDPDGSPQTCCHPQE
jgi:hypothetical protein